MDKVGNFNNNAEVFNTDIAIIGAGPSGLFSAFQAGMLGLKSCIIDCLEDVGGQCSALYPEKPIYDIPAYPIITAKNLIEKLQEQIKPFQPNILLNQKVLSLSKSTEPNFNWKLSTDKKHQINAKAVIIALGGGAFGPNRPSLENIEKFEGKSVFYLVKEMNFFTGKNVVIAGGGDSAIDWSIALSKVAKKIYLVHRREKFRSSPESLRKLQEIVSQDNKIELVVPYQLKSIHGQDNGILELVKVSDLEGKIKELQADVLLPFFGLAMNLSDIKDWGLSLSNDAKHINVNHSTMETSLPGIYAVGDISYYPGKLKLILTGFSEAALASHSAYNFVYPDKALHFQYSTTKGIPNS